MCSVEGCDGEEARDPVLWLSRACHLIAILSHSDLNQVFRGIMQFSWACLAAVSWDVLCYCQTKLRMSADRKDWFYSQNTVSFQLDTLFWIFSSSSTTYSNSSLLLAKGSVWFWKAQQSIIGKIWMVVCWSGQQKAWLQIACSLVDSFG